MNWLIWVALVACVGGVLASAARLRGIEIPRANWLQTLPTIALWGAFIFLVGRFLAVDVSYHYVFLYTSDAMPWQYRIAGAWTGREGSLLLWTAYIATLWTIQTWRPETGKDATPSQWTHFLTGAFLVAFLAALVQQGLFDKTSALFLQGRPGGNGLNPTLLNPYILIHPPMMFAAYALTTALAASGFGHFMSGHNRWSHVLPTQRWNLMLYTVAMGLGGVWAYYTLGFGGFWAWDPVEVANFLPWLALVVTIHMSLQHRRRGDYALAGPLMMTVPFILTLFSALSTRSGLWVSVHAFTDPTNSFNPDAAARFLTILDADPSLYLYVGLIMGTYLAALAFWHRSVSIQYGLLPRVAPVVGAVLGGLAVIAFVLPRHFLSLWFEAGGVFGNVGLGSLGILVGASVLAGAPMLMAPDHEKDKLRIGSRSLLILGAMLLTLTLVASLIFHFKAVNGWNRAYWDVRVPWMVTPMAMALIVLMTYAKRGKQPALTMAASVLGLALLGYYIGGLGWYAVIIALGVFSAGLDKMHHVGTVGGRRGRFGKWLLWVASLLNVIFWLSPPTELGIPLIWPIQVPMGALAIVSVYLAHRVGSGAGRNWHYAVIGVIGGFFIAPVLALAAWFMREETPNKSVARRRQIAVYGMHFVVGLLFVGFAASTYFETEVRAELQLGEGVMVAGENVTFTGAELEVENGRVDRILPHFESGRGDIEAILYWEPQTGSYFPLPATLRSLTGDQYVNVEQICFTDECITVFENRFPATPGDVESITFVMRDLPGINLVWASLGLSALYLGMIAKLGKST
jgi:cytochrome c biogenesis factor